MRYLGAILFLQKRLDFAHCDAADVYGDDLVIEAGKAPLMLGN